MGKAQKSKDEQQNQRIPTDLLKGMFLSTPFEHFE